MNADFLTHRHITRHLHYIKCNDIYFSVNTTVENEDILPCWVFTYENKCLELRSNLKSIKYQDDQPFYSTLRLYLGGKDTQLIPITTIVS